MCIVLISRRHETYFIKSNYLQHTHNFVIIKDYFERVVSNIFAVGMSRLTIQCLGKI